MASLFATTSASGQNLSGADPPRKGPGDVHSASSENRRSIVCCGVLHVPLDERSAAPVLVEPQLEQVRERAAAGVARLAAGDGPVALDERDLVVRLPRAGVVLVAEPVLDDRRPTAQRLVVRVVGVRRVVGEQLADRVGVVRAPRRDVAIEPVLSVVTGHRTKTNAKGAARGALRASASTV